MSIRSALIFYFIVPLLIIQIGSAEENEYGIVRAWFNDKNASVETVNGIKLKLGEPIEIKIEAVSKINGNVYIKITEPGITKAYDISNGPTKEDEWLDNLNIEAGWSKTYTWTLIPNGAWKNGNAPINIYVEFSKIKNDKKIQFTIANPYILDEQYTGAPASAADAPEAAETGTGARAAPFISVVFAICVLWLMGRRGR